MRSSGIQEVVTTQPHGIRECRDQAAGERRLARAAESGDADNDRVLNGALAFDDVPEDVVLIRLARLQGVHAPESSRWAIGR